MAQMKDPSGLRARSGNWHYRIRYRRSEWTGDTELAATKQNVSAALVKREEAKKLIMNGQADRLSIIVKKFDDAAEEFLRWAEGEHREHPNTAKRLRTSFFSLKKFFGNTPVNSITSNSVEKYKTFRRTDEDFKVQEVTIRHDLHALSPFFEYAKNANWCRENPVKQVKIPSGKDALRDHVVTPDEELAYFTTALSKFELEKKGGKKSKRGPFPALHDVARIMLDQGMRPEEVMSLRVEHVDFEKGKLHVVRGKSKSARRTLTMTPAVKFILAKSADSRTQGWVFAGKKAGEHLTKLNNAHDAVIEKIGASFVLYEFRHTYATRFYEATGDLVALARNLGHADLRTVMKYNHPQETFLAKADEKFIATLGEPQVQKAGVIN